MKCPENTVHCKVRKVRDSKSKFGKPRTPVITLYRCEFHGYFKKFNDKNAVSGFLGNKEEPDLDS